MLLQLLGILGKRIGKQNMEHIAINTANTMYVFFLSTRFLHGEGFKLSLRTHVG